MINTRKAKGWMSGLLALALVSTIFSQRVAAQGQEQDDPPSRVARLGHMEGSISFQPAGESEWVQAVSNRPLTTGDKIWADKDSRAELQLGASSIRLNSNTGFSFLNLDDRTIQIQLSAGDISVRVRHLSRDDVFEIDTPNQAFTIFQPGRYRIEASQDGNNTVVSVQEGEGESTGNGQTYTLHPGQRGTFSGTDSLNADVENLGPPDEFDNWSNGRDRRYEGSRSSRYVSHDVVGYEDLDDNGDWRPDSRNGNVWYPHVSRDWAPYRDGHWSWIDPWGWTWVDDEPWGYAPFHYGRWLSIEGRWGWIPGPVEVAPVYAPALVVFVGGGGREFGDNVAWFPLGPREVYVPSYQVSRGYVNRVNVSNTTVNQTTVTNVYNTTIVNNNTTINNVTYANRNVNGAVTAVPQHTFASAQPVARAAVPVNARQLAAAPVVSRAAVPPAREAVLGPHAQTANRVAAPPAAVSNRQVIAKTAPPPPPPAFAARQQQLAAHPGQPVARQEMQRMAPPPSAAAKQPPVRVVAPQKAAAPAANRPGNQPASPSPNQPNNQPANRPGNQPAPNNRPEPNRPQPNQPAPNNRPAEPPARNDRPPAAQPNNPAPNNRPEPNQPAPNNRPGPNRPQPNQPAPNNRPAEPPARNDRPPAAQPNNPAPNNRPEPNQPTPNNRPEPNRPQPNQPAPNNRPAEPPARNDRPPAAQPNNRPEPNQPAPNNRPEANRSPAPQERSQPARPAQNPPPNERPQQRTPPPAEARPPQAQPQRQPTPEERKRQEEQRKQDGRPQPPQ